MIQVSVQGVIGRGILNAIHIVPSGAPAATPPIASTGAPIASINCGGAAFTSVDGTTWTPDQYSTGGDLLYSGYLVNGTQDLALYRSARRGLYGNFGYTIPVPNGSYLVKLKFAELVFSAKGQRVFNVNLNGAPALTNFDILADVAPLTADDKQFPVTVTNGKIQIDVLGVVGFGILNGIQVSARRDRAHALALHRQSRVHRDRRGCQPRPKVRRRHHDRRLDRHRKSALASRHHRRHVVLRFHKHRDSGGGELLGHDHRRRARRRGSPQTVNVTLTVAAAAVPPGVSTSPTTLALSATAPAGADHDRQQRRRRAELDRLQDPAVARPRPDVRVRRRRLVRASPSRARSPPALTPTPSRSPPPAPFPPCKRSR